MFRVMLIPANCKLLFPRILESALVGGWRRNQHHCYSIAQHDYQNQSIAQYIWFRFNYIWPSPRVKLLHPKAAVSLWTRERITPSRPSSWAVPHNAVLYKSGCLKTLPLIGDILHCMTHWAHCVHSQCLCCRLHLRPRGPTHHSPLQINVFHHSCVLYLSLTKGSSGTWDSLTYQTDGFPGGEKERSEWEWLTE